MKLALAAALSASICGCATLKDLPIENATKPKPVEQDIELATNFLNALYRPSASSFRVIADADSESSMKHVPLPVRNKELQDRLKLLMRPPNSVIKVNLRSTTLPEPSGSGHYIYTFDTNSGRLVEIGPHETGTNTADMWIRIDHWPNGTRLLSLSFTWIDDLKTNIFHLRSEERKFRFAIAVEPVN